jgi:uncharacterized protein (DUF488 family)
MSQSPDNETALYTIGFTKKSAEAFFTSLIHAGVRRIIDIRLNNVSQLAGFAKRDNLAYLLKALGGIDYVHRPDLAPTKQLLDAYKKQGADWNFYEREFLALINGRKIETLIDRGILDHGCLLCSEATPEHCHRRLVAEYLRDKMGAIAICHL